MAHLKISTSRLTVQIVLAMIIGVILGLVINQIGNDGFIKDVVVDGVFHVGGKIFVSSLKLIVVPLVFFSLVCGTAALDDIAKLGRIGGRTLGLYLMTTAIAISIALLFTVLLRPGAGFDLIPDLNHAVKEAPSFREVLIGIFPSNPVKAMADGNMLQVIVFSLLFGLAITVSGDAGKRVLKAFHDLNDIVMSIVMMVMMAAPIGVFCLIAKTFSTEGFGAIAPLAKYFFLVLFVLVIQMFVVYPTLLKLFSGLNPIQFFKNFRNVIAFAFSTSSSNATIPVTLEEAENKLGVDESIGSFTIPLGATINMDGTAIMQGVATGFIAQAYGIDIGLSGYVSVILMATMASIGTAGVPGVGLITLAMVLKQVNLPVEGIGLIIGVDRLLDMCRTAVNVTGDATVTCIVAKAEGKLDQNVYDAYQV